MTTKTKDDRLTKKYVDEGFDAQRQYTETLFGKAEGRVKVILDDMIDKKLKDALSIIRPTPKSGDSGPITSGDSGPIAQAAKQVTVRQANEELIRILKLQLQKIAAAYYNHSGMYLDRVSFSGNVDTGLPDISVQIINVSSN